MSIDLSSFRVAEGLPALRHFDTVWSSVLLEMFDQSLAVGGRVSSEGSISAVIFYLLFGAVGMVLATNFKEAAERFFYVISRIMLGITGTSSPRMFRLIGAFIFTLSLAGVAVEAFVILEE